MRIDAGFWSGVGLLAVLFVPLPARSEQPTPVRVTDASCSRCHARISQSYLKTPMANASGMASENLHTGAFLHSSSGTEYKVSMEGHEGNLTYHSSRASGESGQMRLLYFLGSGHLGTTYLYATGDFLFESPIAWYAPTGAYDLKPGLAEIDRMPPPLPMQSGCLRCHMSSVQASDPGTINHYHGLPFLHTGITCESCHGDGAKHVKSNGKDSIVNPARLQAGERDSVCISCHLEGDVSVARAGKSALNYRPGDSISTYLAFYARGGATLTDRAVSEVEQLSQSTCKRVSRDRMSCMSCHDPHYTPDASQRAAFFRSKCLACHNQPDFIVKHHPENQDCTSCHMPQTGARNILHVAWTDHRIRRQPGNSSPATDTGHDGELLPVFSPGASARDRAMADYHALLEGDRSREPAVWKQLHALRDELAEDKEGLDAFGNVSAERGTLPMRSSRIEGCCNSIL